MKTAPHPAHSRGSALTRARAPEVRPPEEIDFRARRQAPDPALAADSYPNQYRKLAARWISDWKEVLTGETVFPDLLAGITVAAVALPLNVALAIAAGLPASAGILAGAVGGLVASFFGGSSLQATGSAAALNVMVFGLVSQFGPQGAYGGAIIVGVTQLLLAFTLLGRYARLLPEVVLAGFTTGVGLKLFNQQLPELLDIEQSVVHVVTHLLNPTWLHDVSWHAVICGLLTIFVVLIGKPWKRFPAALVGIALATFIASYLGWDVHRVGKLPSELPTPKLPALEAAQWLALALKAVPLGLLAAVESLLSAKVIDRMPTLTGVPVKPHEPNLEVFGQGMGNLAAGFFGAPPVSGVIVRSSVNVQSGGRTRLAAIIHGLVLLASTVYIGHYLALVPEAALAGLLCVIGFRLIEISHLGHLLKDDRAGAASFIIAMVGTLMDHLMLGLVAAIGLQALVYFKNRKRHRLDQLRKEQAQQGIRAVVSTQESHAARPLKAPVKTSIKAVENENWERHVSQRPEVSPTAFVHPNASVIGRVVLSDRVHVAAEAALRADEGTPFFIGPETNIQDGAVMHALKGQWVSVGGTKWAIYVGKSVSVAHQALIHGPCFIGDHSFIGFKAVVHNAVLGSGCFVGIGATVVGVEVPDGRYVPHGSVIDTPEKVASLPKAEPSHAHFNEDVVEVNLGLAEAYHAHAPRTDDEGDLETEAAPYPKSVREFNQSHFTEVL